jgi:outer membrane protein assembly factor BamB
MIGILPVLLLGLAVPGEDDWPQFRGPLGSGESAEKELPLEWNAGKNVRWRAPLPEAGNSSPIVSRNRVFVTVAEDKGRKRSLLCLDRTSGKTLWTRTVSCAVAEPTQKDNPYCGSTPAADGERVIVWHSSAGAHAYDFEGKPLWSRDLGTFDHMWGYGASPILHQDRVILNCGPGDRTFLVALDKRTGEILWKRDEPGGSSKEWIGSWSTPRVVDVEGAPQLVVALPSHVQGYDPATGKVLWTCGGLGKLIYADVVVGGGIAVVTGEDEGGDSIAFRLGGQGDVTGRRLWARKRSLEVSTGLIIDRHLWTVDGDGILRCTEAETGKEVLKERSPKGAAWSSMVRAAGRVYYTARSGETIVFRPSPKALEVLAVNPLGEPSNATPAISDGELFLRTSKAVYCISEKR